jgi:putative oxidoreductase
MGGAWLVLPAGGRIVKQLERLYRQLIRIDESLQSPFLLAVRLYWGWQFVEDGWGKLHNLEKVTDFFTSLGLPAPGLTATFIGGLELVGGILLAIGLGSQLIALLLTCNMLMAYITADREALFSVFSEPDKFYGATPYTYLFASLIVLIFGPGKFSVDAWLTKKWK